MPFAAAELEVLFAQLRQYSTIVLAVSGGADSVALMLLAARWRARTQPAGRFIVATVDHGLREQSAAEATWVAEQACAVGFEHIALQWADTKPPTGIQEAARVARYRLLAGLAQACLAADERAAVVTAHTQDDQAETLLMRLARGSGVDGLGAMQPVRPAMGGDTACDLVRPLLHVRGARLREVLRSEGLSWLEDPSNDLDRFERVRIRKAAAQLAEIGLENEKIALSARRIARAREALDRAVDDLQQQAGLDLHAGAFASFKAQPWLMAAEELRLRLVGRLTSAFGGQRSQLSLGSLEALVERMSALDFEGATLGGAIIELVAGEFRVMREGLRAPLPELSLTPGGTVMWDGRFRVRASTAAERSVSVSALGPAAYSELRHIIDVPRGWPARAVATLPAIRSGHELLVVPQLASFPGAPAAWNSAVRLYSAEFAP